MAIISVASAKGGCSKTTLTLLLGTELVLSYGYKAVVLDCDINQHASEFAKKARIKGFTVVPDVKEDNILPELRKARDGYDLILVDLPGGTTNVALKALQRSDFVMIPCRKNLPDMRDAAKTVAQIEDAQELAQRRIARSMIWSQVPAGFESKVDRYVRETAERTAEKEKLYSIFNTVLFTRAGFSELHVTGKVPRQANPESPAAENIAAIAKEFLSNLEKMTEAA